MKIYIDLSKEDALIVQAIDVIFEAGGASRNLLKDKLGVGSGRANKIIKSLRAKQLIGPKVSGGRKSIILERKKNIEYIEASSSTEDFDNTTSTKTNQYRDSDDSGGMPIINPETGKVMDIFEFMDYYGIPKEHLGSYKMVAHQKGYQTYNIASKRITAVEDEDWREALIEEIKNHAPKYPTIKRNVSKDPHLLLFDSSDIHIGKYGSTLECNEDYNIDIALQRVTEGIEGILVKSSGFDIDQVVVVIGNDVLHTDTPKKTTTSGTPQDTVGLWHENFITAKKMYVRMIEELLVVADVHVIFNPSNHDWQQGFCLAQTVEAHFNNSHNVTFNTTMHHRKYYVYGENLIGTTHGDSCKREKLPLVMATEAADLWSKSKKRFWYTHHVHSKHTEDFTGVTVESVRSPSGEDGWHHREGFIGSPKAIEGFIHHKTQGQIARLSHYFD